MKLQSQHLLVAVFLVFVFAMATAVFVPNITAAAAMDQQADGLPVILLWALPVMVIIAVIMFCSHRAVRASKITD
jgi:uncharacterized BrkB/YihY/UPF0761 family membrane protein